MAKKNSKTSLPPLPKLKNPNKKDDGSLLNALLGKVDNKEDNFKEEDDDFLSSIDSNVLKDFQSVRGSMEKGIYDPQLDELNRLGVNPNLSDEHVDKTAELATAQPLGEQLKNMVIGGAYNFAAGFIDDWNFDIPDIADLVRGKEKEYGNWLSDITKKLRKGSEDYRIYQHFNDYGDPAHWINVGESLAYTAGLSVSEIGKQLALSALTSATLGGTIEAQGASFANAVRLGSMAVMGALSGINEGYINARDTYDETKQKYLDNGYNEKDAIKYAAKAASIAYRAEVGPLMALNALQFATIGKFNIFSKEASAVEVGYSGAAERLTGLLTKKIEHKGLKRALEFVLGGLAEGAEEGIQTADSKYGKHTVMKETNDVFTDANYWDQDMWDNIIPGIFGGLFFTGFGKAMNGITSKVGGKNNTAEIYGKAHDSFIAKATTLAANNLHELRKAVEKKDQYKIDNLRYKMHKENVLEALELDYINQKETAFNTYVGTLEEVKKAAQNGDLETLKKYGADTVEDLKYIVENYDKYISDAKNIKNSFIKNFEKTGDFGVASILTDAQESLKYANIKLSEITNKRQEFYAQDDIFNSLSNDIKNNAQERYILMNEKAALLLSKKIRGKLTGEQKERLKEIEEELPKLKVSSREEKIVNNLRNSANSEEIVKNHLNEYDLRAVQEAAIDKIEYWQNPKNIKKEVKRRGTRTKEDEEREKAFKELIKEVEKENRKREDRKKANTPEDKVKPESKKKGEKSKIYGFTLDEIKKATGSKNQSGEFDLNNATEASNDELFSRRNLPKKFDSMISEKDLEAARNYYREIGNPDFEGVIKNLIEEDGIEKTSEDFEFHAKFYEKVKGLNEAEKQRVHDKYFNSHGTYAESIANLKKKLDGDNQEDVKKSNDKESKAAGKLLEPNKKVNTSNFTIEDKRVGKGLLKFAYRFLDAVKDEATGIWRSVSLVLKPIKKNDLIQNHYTLDPRFIYDIAEESKNSNVLVVKKMDIDGLSVGDRTWGEVKEDMKKKLKDKEAEYEDWYMRHVPMAIIYQGSRVETPVIVNQVHVVDWHNEENISDRKGIDVQQEEIERGQKITMELRQKVLSTDETVGVPIEISDGSNLYLHVDQVYDDVPRPISEIAGGATLAVVESSSTNGYDLKLSDGTKIDKRNIKAFLSKDEVWKTGQVVDIREDGVNETGETTYIAFRSMNDSKEATGNLEKELPKGIQDTLKYALLSNILLRHRNIPRVVNYIKENFDFTIDQAEKIAASIDKEFKIDITSINKRLSKTERPYKSSGLYDFMEAFARMPASNILRYQAGSSYLDVSTNTFEDELAGSLNSYLNETIGENNKIKDLFIDYKPKFSNRKNVTLINEKGDLKETSKSYEETMKDFFKTNIVSHKIQTIDGGEKWITNVQPLIEYHIKDVEEKPLSKKVDKKINTETENKNQDGSEKFPGTVREVIDFINNSNLTEEEKEIAIYQVSNINTKLQSRRNILDIQEKLREENKDAIEGLTIQEQKDILESLKHNVMSSLNLNEVKFTGDIVERVNRIVEETINRKVQNQKNIFLTLQETKNELVISKVREGLQKIEILNTNIDKVKDFLLKDLSDIFDAKLEEIKSVEEDSNFSLSTFEKNIKLRFGAKLKGILFGFEKRGNNSELAERDNTGLFVKYESPDTIYDNLIDITTSIPSNWELLIATLKGKYSQNVGKDDKIVGKKLYKELADRLLDLPFHLRMELLYKTIAKKNTFLKPLIKNSGKVLGYVDKITGMKTDKTDKDAVYISTPEKYGVSILDENSAKIDRVIKSGMEYNINEIFFHGGLFDKSYASKVVQSLDKLKDFLNEEYKKDNPDYDAIAEKARKAFDALGLSNISDNTIGTLVYEQRDIENKNTFFGNLGIFKMFRNKLKRYSESTKDLIKDDITLIKDMGTPINAIVDREIELNGSFTPKSVYVNGDTLQGVSANTHLFDMNQRLVRREEILNFLLSIPGTQHNAILHILLENEDMQKEFGKLAWVSKNSIKIKNKKNSQNAEYDNTGEIGHLLTQFAYFTSTKGLGKIHNEFAYKGNDGVAFRIGYSTLGIALSDKGRMVIQKIPLVKIDSRGVTVLENGSLKVKGDLMNFMIEQTFLSELEKIQQSYQNEEHINKEEEIFSRMFHTIPSFNSITVEGENLTQYLNNTKGYIAEEVKENILEQVKDKINSFLNHEVDSKVTADGKSGFLIENGIYTPEVKHKSNLHNIDTNYIDRSIGNTRTEQLRTAFLEFTINNMLATKFTTDVYLGGIEYYGKNKILPRSITGEIDYEALGNPETYSKTERELAANLQKRAALLIAPGLKRGDSESPNSKMPQHYMHLALADAEGPSNILKKLIQEQYGKFNKEKENAWNVMQRLKEEYNNPDTTQNRKAEIKSELNDIKENEFPEVADYFNIEGTDAQEYTTLQERLITLLGKGVISEEEKSILEKKERLSPEDIKTIMSLNIGQPEKTVYAGVIMDEKNRKARPIYIKSSTFPLIPQLTKNLKIDKLRQLMEKAQVDKDGSFTPVRASYQTANKIGATSSPLSLDDVYDDNINDEKLFGASTKLNYADLKFQQETPSKEEKGFLKGKDSYITMSSQAFRQLLGNFINVIERKAFNNGFSENIKKELGLTEDKLTGEQLEKAFTHVYNKYSNLLMGELLDELGIKEDLSFFDSDLETRNVIITNLQRIIKKEIEGRNYPEHLLDSIGLVRNNKGEVQIESSLLFDNNRHKFEALLNSIVQNRLVSHKLPGNSHILGSSEGFEKAKSFETLSNNEKTGIIWINGFKSELKATYTKLEDGKEVISEAEGLLQSHWKYKDSTGNFKYVDLSEPYIKHEDGTETGYSKEIKDEEGNTIGLELVESRIDPELRSMFSFRTPWSSHQSGTIVKIVGFLPNTMQDLFITSKDFLVQIGEDFDVDKRNIYKSNYYVDENGNIKKLNQEYVNKELASESLLTFEERLNIFKSELNSLGETWRQLKWEEIFLENDKYPVEKLKKTLEKIFKRSLSGKDMVSQELEHLVDEIGYIQFQRKTVEERQRLISQMKRKLYNGNLKTSSERFRNRVKNQLKIKLLENDIIEAHKAVFTSPDAEVRQKIFKPLSTAESEKTAKVIDNIVNKENTNENFSLYSDSFQRELLFNGADGKMGTAIHSNAVIFEAQLQRLKDEVRLGEIITDYETGEPIYIPFDLKFGNGIRVSVNLGQNQKTQDGMRDVVDLHGEAQNRDVDNINKQLMGKINENGETLDIFTLFNHSGVDATMTNVTYEFNGKMVEGKLNFPSLFMSQPVLRDYVKLLKRYNGVFGDYMSPSDREEIIIDKLGEKYGFENWRKSGGNPNTLNITGQALVDNLTTKAALKNPGLQRAVLFSYLKMKGIQQQLEQARKTVNFSNSKIGVSYFNTLERIALLDSMGDRHFEEVANDFPLSNFIKLVGEISKVEKPGYTKIGKYYWKPTTLEGVMTINALKTSNAILPVFFPYNSNVIKDIITGIFNNNETPLDKITKNNTKWRYEIMTEFTNFVNSNIGFFEGDVKSERNRLFFDTPTNTALGSIIGDLKRLRHPITNNLILRDLTIEKDDKTGIVKIIHSANEESRFDKKSKSDIFKEMLVDNRELKHDGETLIYNGEPLTVAQLAQDLISYSYLSNDMNGAIGYKNYIPASYLSKLGIFENHREIFNAIANNKPSFEINGIKYSTESLVKDFIAQYFQHNPSRANIVNEEELSKLLKEPDSAKEYLSIRQPSKENPWRLYHYNNATKQYDIIDTLGDNGIFKEYNLTRGLENSLIKENKKESQENKTFRVLIKGRNTYVITPQGKYRDIKDFEKILKTSKDFKSARSIINYIANSKYSSPEQRRLAEELKSYTDDSVKIVFNDKAKNPITYNYKQHTITIKPSIIEDFTRDNGNDYNKAQSDFREALLEEVFHSLTAREMLNWIEITNTETKEHRIKDNAPAFMYRLDKAYKEAKKALPYDDSTAESHLRTYSSSNIFEFVHGYFSNEEYREDIEKANPGFRERFLKAIQDLIKYLKSKITGKYPNYKEIIVGDINTLLKANKNRLEGKPLPSASEELKNMVSKTEIDNSTERANIKSLYTNEEDIREYKGIKYRLNSSLSSLAVIKADGTVELRPLSSTKEFWDYFIGNEDNPSSKQKREVLKQLEKQGITLDNLHSFFDTKKKMYEFLLLHEKSHIENMDRKVYWKSGENLLTQDKIDIETRATIDALKDLDYFVNRADTSVNEGNVNKTEIHQDFTNHSGGAYGGDTMWDIIGREEGFNNHNHYKDSNNSTVSKRLRDIGVKATILTKEQMDFARQKVKELLGVNYADNLKGNLQVRNFYQVYNSDAVFAVATLNKERNAVSGGTNTAVQLGIKLDKPVHVWDTDSESWYKYNPETEQFEKTDTPILTKNYAGVGTRNVENYNVKNKETGKWEPRKEYVGHEKAMKAAQAVRDVYKKTKEKLNSKLEIPENKIVNPNEKLTHKKGYKEMLIGRNKKVGRVSAKSIIVPGYEDLNLAVTKEKNKWRIFDIKSGLTIEHGKTIKEAIKKTKEMLDSHGHDNSIKIVKESPSIESRYGRPNSDILQSRRNLTVQNKNISQEDIDNLPSVCE